MLAKGQAWVVLLSALALCGLSPDRGGTARDLTIARWKAAQLHAIAAIAQPAARARAARAWILRARALDRPVTAPSVPPLHRLAVRELSIPGRYTTRAPVARSAGWLTRWWQWLSHGAARLLRALFGGVRPSRGEATLLGDLLVVLATAMVAIAAVRALWMIRLERRGPLIAGEPIEPTPSADLRYRQALALAERGNYTEAARALYAATLGLLVARGDLRERPSATVGDQRSALRARGTAATFDAVAEAFVAGTYGDRSIGLDEWRRALAAFHRLAV